MITFDVEIVLRERNYAVTEQVRIPLPPGEPEREPGEWTDADVAEVLKGILRAIARVKDPGSDEHYVALRGFSWIVEPVAEGGVVIAIEIPTGAAVAGPFAVTQTRLDGAVARVVAAAAPAKPVVH